MSEDFLAPLTPIRDRDMTRRAVVFTAAAVLAGCGSSAHGASVLATTTVSQRYTAAADPANAALAAMLKRALAYGGGSTAELDAATTPTATTLRDAARRVDAIAAPGLLRRDIHDVASTLNAVVADLTALRTAKGNDVQARVSRLVADAGREAAADNLVRLFIAELATPTTESQPTLEPPTSRTTRATTTTSVSQHTTTTRARSSTTTTRRATTSTSKP